MTLPSGRVGRTEGVPNPWSVPSEEHFAGSHRENYNRTNDARLRTELLIEVQLFRVT
jgi:hypothetical protein